MPSDQTLPTPGGRPWNKGQLIGQKRPLKPKDVWAIRVRLELHGSQRDVALFDLAIDSKLRACDLVRLKIQDVYVGSRTRERTTIIQKKTGRPVQFEISLQTRAALEALLEPTGKISGDYLFPSRFEAKDHLSIRQYARLVTQEPICTMWLYRSRFAGSASLDSCCFAYGIDRSAREEFHGAFVDAAITAALFQGLTDPRHPHFQLVHVNHLAPTNALGSVEEFRARKRPRNRKRHTE